MKIRTDFVTNSSSSSFVIARKGELNKAQKEKLIEYIEKKFLGSEEFTEDSLREYADDYGYEPGDTQYDIREQALQKGMDVRTGWVSFDEAEWHIANIFESIWEILEENGDGNFEVIDGDLSY